MKSKTLSLLSLSILTLIMFVSLASATLTLTEVKTPTPVNHNSDVTITFNLTSDADYSTLDWSSVDPSKGTWKSLPTIDSIISGTVTLTAVLTINEHASGDITGAQIIVNDTNTSNTTSLPIPQITITDSSTLSVSDATISSNENSTTITIKNTGNTQLANIALTSSGIFTVDFNDTDFSLNAGKSQNVLVTPTGNLNKLVGSNSITIIATSDNTTAQGTLTLDLNYCSVSNPNDNIQISIEDIKVKEGFGKDEDYWYPLDEIEIEIDIENDGNDDIKDIVVEWGVYDKNLGKWIIEEEENDFNLKDGKKETLFLNLKLNDDIDEFVDGDFVFFVKATGEDRDNNKEEICESKSESVDIVVENDFVILYDIKFPEPVSCGEEIRVTADVWNIGEDDQDEVYVEIYNKELGIDKKITLGDIDAFEDEKLDTLLKIPNDAKEKTYGFIFRIFDEDNDLYENNENDESEFTIPIRVGGSCSDISKPNAIVSASLESGGKAGEELIVKATIVNTGDEKATYLINAAKYTEWALEVKITPNEVTLEPGASKDILFTFKVKEDALVGDNLFDIEVISESNLIIQQPVSVPIEEASKFGLSSITGSFITKDNWHLWGIGFLNIILVLMIIFIGLKIARK